MTPYYYYYDNHSTDINDIKSVNDSMEAWTDWDKLDQGCDSHLFHKEVNFAKFGLYLEN